jgi:LPXTG-motif cell wall-anchored protein
MHPAVARDPNAHTFRRWGRLIAGLVAGLLALTASVAAITPVAAAETAPTRIPGAITSVTTDKTSYGYSERLKLTFTWAVPDDSRPGDTFALDLPDALAAASLARFPLDAPDGQTVANAEWSGKSVVFTLTDYVASHDAVSGSGYLTVQWDHSVVTETGGPVTLTFGATATRTVTIDPKPGPPAPCTSTCGPAPVRTERGLWKGASWADGSYEGTRDDADNINWLVEVPGKPTGYAGPVTVDDTVGAGSVVDCATLTVTTRPSLAGGTRRTPVDPSRYTLGCADGGFRLVLDRVGPSEFIDIAYKGTITDQRAGVYTNSVTITAPGDTWTRTSTIKRTAAGGIGDGVQSVSVGDLVWLDADRDGVQDEGEAGIPGVTLALTGPAGEPVTTIDGAAVTPTETGADGRYSFTRLPVLPAGQHYRVTIDQGASATALDGLAPTLPAVGDDRAVDSSTGSAESTDLTTNRAADLTLDFGFVTPTTPAGGEHPQPDPEDSAASTPQPTPVALPSPVAHPIPAATPVPATAPAAAESATLAHTGSEIAVPLGLAAALVLLGVAGAAFGRRRRTS